MSEFVLIEGSITKGRQDVIFKYLTRLGDHKVRFTIRSDAYEQSCYARAEVWNSSELKWNTIASLLSGEMKTETGIAYYPANRLNFPGSSGIDERHFEQDYNHLMRLVKEILE